MPVEEDIDLSDVDLDDKDELQFGSMGRVGHEMIKRDWLFIAIQLPTLNKLHKIVTIQNIHD